MATHAVGIEQQIKHRYISLDYLRGILAISIMFYHFLGGAHDFHHILGKLGAYAVSMFFVLSGLSLAVVYNSLSSIKLAIRFYLLRFLRIMPLFFIVTSLSAILNWKSGIAFLPRVYFTNITLLFGFLNPMLYLAEGGWSIGNEMVYYSITPLMIFLYSRSKLWGNLLVLTSGVPFIIFAYFLLDKDVNLASQWDIYINPLNNLFFYMIGLAIFYNLSKIKFNHAVNITLLFVTILLFCLIPTTNGLIGIVTGNTRMFLSIISIIIVIIVYKMQIFHQLFIGKLFELFGMATYGVYLLHPIVYRTLSLLLHLHSSHNGLKGVVAFFCAVIITPCIAVLSYYKFEKPFVQYGKSMLNKR